MRDAEARGYNPDERLREVVSQALMDGWRRNREEAGLEGGVAAVPPPSQQQQPGQEEQDSKRSRME